MAAEILKIQTAEGAPRPTGIDRGTDLILPPERIADRVRHFVEEVYNTSPESHIVRFMKVLLGDAGAGQLRKRLTVVRLQQALQGTHFFDLDRFYGALFGLRRHSFEKYVVNPYVDTATIAQWQDIAAKDGSYRSRVEQFARAITYGPTPTGIELAAEAVLAVDCDVYESFLQADSGYRTYAELESDYGVGTGGYADMQGVSYADLEGDPLPRLDALRREFTVQPKRPITLEEAYNLGRVLDRIKPADSRFTVDADGLDLHMAVPLRGLHSDSSYWEIVPHVSARPITTLDPYLNSSGEPVEQPRPPFSGYQGEAWSYNGVVAGATAYSLDEDGIQTLLPVQRVVFPDGSFMNYETGYAVMPQRYVQAGRAVSDAIMVTHPYSTPRAAASTTFDETFGVQVAARPSLGTLYADRVPVEDLNRALGTTEFTVFRENMAQRYWVSPERDITDPTREIVEVRLATDRPINYVTFEVAHYPQTISVEVYQPPTEENTVAWRQVYADVISDSMPAYVNPSNLDAQLGHPLHYMPGHWKRYGVRIDAVNASRVRVVMRRTLGAPPRLAGRSGTFVPYSLGLRGLDLGYRVSSRQDAAVLAGQTIGSATDVLGSLVEYRLYEQPAANLLGDGGWRSEPQPVNYAVVTLYADTRDEQGEPQTLDRFYVDPTHSGSHISIYWSNSEVDEPDDAFFEQAVWTPIPRDYLLTRGFIHIPPTRAKFFKFEFTNLTAEVYESFVPILRRVKLFPREVVDTYRTRQRGIAVEAMPEGLAPSVDIRSTALFSDGRFMSFITAPDETQSLPTEAVYAVDPAAAERLRNLSFTFAPAPWHQEIEAPRFSQTSQHRYETVEVRHTTKTAFFVGLNALRAYRVDYGMPEDTQVYIEHFWDAHDIQPAFTWEMDPGVLYASHSGAEARSRVFTSHNNVRALQFATQQSDPAQIAPDADFQDPVLATYTWDDENSWQRVGDTFLSWIENEHAVLMGRQQSAVLKPIKTDRGPVRSLVSPVFSFRDRMVAVDPSSEGGIQSPLLTPSPEVRIYAAARVILDTDLTSPLTLQIVAGNNDQVIAEKEVTGHKGEMLEWYISHDMGVLYIPPLPPVQYQFRSLVGRPVQELIGGPTPTVEIDNTGRALVPDDVTVRVRLIQKGRSDDRWRLDNLSLFDEGIIWEFSVNGGTDWTAAHGIRNNANGVMVFPEPGNQLAWRARGMRPGMAIDYLKMRPWYLGRRNARQSGIPRGPNLSTYDHDPPIEEDPDFTSWTIPIPRGWWYANKRHPLLPVEGLPNVTPFSRFYNRTANDDISAHTLSQTWGALRLEQWQDIEDDTWGELGTSGGARDEVTWRRVEGRQGEEYLASVSPVGDAVARTGSVYHRHAGDALPATSDDAINAVAPPSDTIPRPPIQPPD